MQGYSLRHNCMFGETFENMGRSGREMSKSGPKSGPKAGLGAGPKAGLGAGPELVQKRVQKRAQAGAGVQEQAQAGAGAQEQAQEQAQDPGLPLSQDFSVTQASRVFPVTQASHYPALYHPALVHPVPPCPVSPPYPTVA